MPKLIRVIICAGMPTIKIKNAVLEVATQTILYATRSIDQIKSEVKIIFHKRFLVQTELKISSSTKYVGKGKIKQSARREA